MMRTTSFIVAPCRSSRCTSLGSSLMEVTSITGGCKARVPKWLGLLDLEQGQSWILRPSIGVALVHRGWCFRAGGSILMPVLAIPTLRARVEWDVHRRAVALAPHVQVAGEISHFKTGHCRRRRQTRPPRRRPLYHRIQAR